MFLMVVNLFNFHLFQTLDHNNKTINVTLIPIFILNSLTFYLLLFQNEFNLHILQMNLF